MKYVGFWRRFGAYWLDIIALSPLMALSIWGNENFRLFPLYLFIPSLLIGIWFYVYLVKKYGGTPGKLLLKIKIVKLNGQAVGYKEALLRYSVLFIFSTLLSLLLIITVLQISDSEYFSMNWQERGQYILHKASPWYFYINIMLNIWIWSEFIVMLTNKQRRALHDFIAGTIVIQRKELSVDSESINQGETITSI